MKKIIYILTAFIISISCNKSNSNCNDGTQDGSETGIDCGGDCAPCQTCNDGIKNQNEIQIDCGGDCIPCAIEYPPNGTHGVNILHGDDSLFLNTNVNYSFRSIIPEGSSLKVELNLINGSPWLYGSSSPVGWSVSSYNNGYQTFEAINGGTTDLQMMSYGSTILIKYFENGTSVSKEKILVIQ